VPAIANAATVLPRSPHLWRAAMSDISYADGARHRLDVYRARSAASSPVIVFFYGGSWQTGEKGWYRLLAKVLAARGYAVVVPDYRLYPEAAFPDFLNDGAAAVRWTRDNAAQFNGDPRRLFVMGHSAGAYIAAMLALDPKWLAGAGLDSDVLAGFIGISGPYDFLPLRDPRLITIFGGADRPMTQPISYAFGRKPPALLLTGANDSVVDPGNSKRLAEQLRRSGQDATDVSYPLFGHLTVLAGFAPLLGSVLPLFGDVDAFVARAGRNAPHASAASGTAASP
jgi:acetyl esterase/lipase